MQKRAQIAKPASAKENLQTWKQQHWHNGENWKLSRSQLEISRQSMQKQSSRVEKNKPATVNKACYPLPNDEEDTELGFSTTKSAQNDSSKFEKNKTTDSIEKDPYPLHNDEGDMEPGIATKTAQNHQSIKVERSKTTDTVERAPDPLPNDDGDTDPGISTTKSTQNQSSKVENNKAPIPPRKKRM